MKISTLFLFLLVSFNGISQEIDILYNTTWKLLSFDYNGESYPIPSESNTALLFINEQNPDTFSTFIKTNSISGTISIDEGNETMDIFDTEITLLECEEYCDLEAAYIDFFYNDGIPKQFIYSIVVFVNDIEYILVITDNEGNEAQYYDFNLSQEDFDKMTFSIYPNPVINQLFWLNQTFNTINIYSVQGKLLLNFKGVTNSVDVSRLMSGVYFIELIKEDKSVVKKFVKK